MGEITLQYDGNRLLIAPTGLYSSLGVSIPQYFSGDNLNRLPSLYIAGNCGINYGPSWAPWWNAYNAYQAGDNLTSARSILPLWMASKPCPAVKVPGYRV